MSDFPSLAPGTLLAGKFRIETLLGAGGMGSVYAVRHELTRHRRALKLLHPSVQLVPDLVRRFLNEASAAGRAGSPHLVETFDAGTLPSGEPYVVMELLEGQSLSRLLEQEKRLGVPRTAELVAQAAKGIHAAHGAGIVHRDLKPENLFVTTREGQPFVKILDFGISKFTTSSGELVTSTRSGALMGSPAFMSPEQMLGSSDVDARSDIYALGVVLFQCLSGALPFEAATLQMLMARILEGKRAALDALQPDLPPALVAVVDRALAWDRAARFQTAQDFYDALGPFRDTPRGSFAPLSFEPTLRSDALPGPSRVEALPTRRSLAAVGWASIGVVAVCGGWFALRGPAQSTPDAALAASSKVEPVGFAGVTGVSASGLIRVEPLPSALAGLPTTGIVKQVKSTNSAPPPERSAAPAPTASSGVPRTAVENLGLHQGNPFR